MADIAMDMKTGYATLEEYEAISYHERMEWIGGRLYAMAGANTRHQRISFYMARTIADYIDKKGGDCEVFTAPYDVHVFYYMSDDAPEDKIEAIVQPDVLVVCDKDKLTDKRCEGAPDWVIEIVSPSDPSHDYLTKLNIYRTSGVRLYWIVDPEQERILSYDFGNEDVPLSIYSISDVVPVSIYDDLSIDFSQV